MADDLTLPVRVTGAREGAREFDVLANGIDRARRGTVYAAGSFDFLAHEIDKTERQVRQLSDEFKRTGDLDLLKKIKGATAARAQLRAIAKDLDNVGDQAAQAERKVERLGRQLGKTAATGAAAGFLEQLRTVGGAISGAGSIVLPVALAVAIPSAAAAAMSLTLTTIGLSGLTAGLVLAAGDPKVKTAFGKLRDRLMDIDTADLEKAVVDAQDKVDRIRQTRQRKGLTEATTELRAAQKALADAQRFNAENVSLRDLAKPFVGPLVGVADRLGVAFTRLQPTLEKVFATLAPVVSKLSEGLGGFLERFLGGGGFAKAIEAAKPALQVLAEHLPKLGDSFDRFFRILAEHGPAAAAILHGLLELTEMLIPAVAQMLVFFGEGLLKVGGFFISFRDTVVAAVNTIIDALNRLPGVNIPKIGGTDKGKGINENQRFAAASSGNVGGSRAVHARATGGPVWPGGQFRVGESGPERLTMFSGGGGYVTPLAPRGGDGDVIGTLRVVHVTPTGEEIRTEFVKLRRQRRLDTFDKMVPA